MKNDRGMIDDTYRDGKIWNYFSGIFESIILFVGTNKPTHENSKALLELKESVKNIEVLQITESDANNDWIKHSNSMIYNSLNSDPSLFLRWPAVRDTMNVTNSKFIMFELRCLKKMHNWKSFWKNFIIETWIGGQIPFIFYPKSSGNSIHLAYVISQFMEKTNKSFNDFDFIFEFGGGYGNLCRLIHKAGFSGRYVMYDFPIVSAFQRYYLSSSNLKTRNIEEDGNRDGIYCNSDVEKVTKYLNEKTPANKSRNLFVATWSLSESPISIRRHFDEIFEKFDYFLMGYQDKFGEVNNRDYFEKIKKSRDDIEWYDWPISYLPAHNFLIGKKKNS